MIDIRNRKDCSTREINDLKSYLKGTPVHCLFEVIGSGAKVSKGEITLLSEIGKLKTIWSELGGMHKSNENANDKFLVHEVMGALHNPRCTDSVTLYKINEFIQLRTSDHLELKITLGEKNDDITIYDGNKRVVACYECGEEKMKSNLSIPVYIITLP